MVGNNKRFILFSFLRGYKWNFSFFSLRFSLFSYRIFLFETMNKKTFHCKKLTTIILTALRWTKKDFVFVLFFFYTFCCLLAFWRNLLLDVLLNRISIESSYFIQLPFLVLCVYVVFLFKKRTKRRKRIRNKKSLIIIVSIAFLLILLALIEISSMKRGKFVDRLLVLILPIFISTHFWRFLKMLIFGMKNSCEV